MNTNNPDIRLEDPFFELRGQLEHIEESTDDLGEQAALYADLIETVTGRGIGMNGEEIQNAENRLADRDAASDFLHEIAEKMDPVLAALETQYPDGDSAMAVFKAYRHIADDFIHTAPATIRLPEKVIAAAHAPYELDLGTKPMSGAEFEDKLLYPKDHHVWRPTERQMDTMPRLSENDAYAEAMIKNPYRHKPWDPDSRWLADMQYLISQEMGLDRFPVVVADNCVIPVPCIGLSADIFYGVDCFIVFRDPEGAFESVVTIDISLDPFRKMVTGYKADLLYTPNGIYIHPDLPIKLEFTDKVSRKIDAPRVNERRTKAGHAMVEIIRYRAAHPELSMFRFPDQKNVSVSSAQHRTNMRLRKIVD